MAENSLNDTNDCLEPDLESDVDFSGIDDEINELLFMYKNEGYDPATLLTQEKTEAINEAAIPQRLSKASSLISFFVTLEKQVNLNPKNDRQDFDITSDRNMLVALTINEDDNEKKIFLSGTDTNTILCEIAQKLRELQQPVLISPIELLIVGREIGKVEGRTKLGSLSSD